MCRNGWPDGGTLRHHPLKVSMCPPLPAPLPLCFHANTKGSQIVMDKTQRSVRRLASFCNAITFTNRPVRVYEQVRLKITKKQGCWSGALRVGFSMVDPSDLSSAWLPRFACPDLVSERGFWARALPEEQCEEGTILSFWLDNTGRVFYRVNNSPPIFFFGGVPVGEPVWAIIDIYGLTRGVQLLDSKMVPAEYLCTTVTHEGMDEWHLSSSCSEFDLQEDLPSFSSSPNALNSVLSRQLNDDLHFHCVHGNGLRLLTEHIAVRYYNRREDCALAFTHRPLRCGECVFLKVSLRSSALNGFLSYGFTSCNPAHINPKHLPVNPGDLLDRKEFWAFSCLTSPLVGGDIIGFRATAEGEVLALPVVTLHPVQKSRGPSLVTSVTSQSIRFTVQQSEVLRTALSPAHRVSAVLQVRSFSVFHSFIFYDFVDLPNSSTKNIFLIAVFSVIAVLTRNNFQFTLLRISQYPVMLCDYW
ncbi:E3 ubiquitin- ligase NEURL1-like isoform X2 [Labeo rohita]|uniref:E3 ubiquitin-ligase NEURL1-like isoform X2 n=1 Tax=Labeo rohita TaxID=84645 RepID=A0A498LKH9_LABRO|nr:E3 ubiquitin- ligase NEURL1-like isoform X2 [Labeo rohita]